MSTLDSDPTEDLSSAPIIVDEANWYFQCILALLFLLISFIPCVHLIYHLWCSSPTGPTGVPRSNSAHSSGPITSSGRSRARSGSTGRTTRSRSGSRARARSAGGGSSRSLRRGSSLSERVKLLMDILVTVSMISFFFHIAIQLIYRVRSSEAFNFLFPLNQSACDMFNFFINTLYYVGKGPMFMFFVLRSWMTFKGSVQEYSVVFIILMFVVVVASHAALNWFFVTFWTERTGPFDTSLGGRMCSNNYLSTQDLDENFILLIVDVLVVMLLSFATLYMLVGKLFQLAFIGARQRGGDRFCFDTGMKRIELKSVETDETATELQLQNVRHSNRLASVSQDPIADENDNQNKTRRKSLQTVSTAGSRSISPVPPGSPGSAGSPASPQTPDPVDTPVTPDILDQSDAPVANNNNNNVSHHSPDASDVTDDVVIEALQVKTHEKPQDSPPANVNLSLANALTDITIDEEDEHANSNTKVSFAPERKKVERRALSAHRPKDVELFHEFTRQENDILFLSIKLFTLIMAASLTTLLAFILWEMGFEDAYAMDSLVNMFCLWLAFGFTHEYYLHYFLGNWCIKCLFPCTKTYALTCCSECYQDSDGYNIRNDSQTTSKTVNNNNNVENVNNNLCETCVTCMCGCCHEATLRERQHVLHLSRKEFELMVETGDYYKSELTHGHSHKHKQGHGGHSITKDADESVLTRGISLSARAAAVANDEKEIEINE